MHNENLYQIGYTAENQYLRINRLRIDPQYKTDEYFAFMSGLAPLNRQILEEPVEPPKQLNDQFSFSICQAAMLINKILSLQACRGDNVNFYFTGKEPQPLAVQNLTVEKAGNRILIEDDLTILLQAAILSLNCFFSGEYPQIYLKKLDAWVERNAAYQSTLNRARAAFQ